MLDHAYTARYANGLMIHCPICATPIYTEAEIRPDGTVERRLTPTAMAHIQSHEQGRGCTCVNDPEADTYQPQPGTSCDHHHGYVCGLCAAGLDHSAHRYERGGA